jgi:hypothetical protein
MNNPATPPLPDLPRPIRHETSDVNPYYVALAAFILALSLAVIFPFLSWIFWRFESAARKTDAPRSLVADDQAVPPPTLQENPTADLIQFRNEEEQKLSSYAWIERDQGTVRIPIERAILILSERGLPEPAGPPQLPAPAVQKERAP